MAELADLSLRDLLERVATPEPGPSAGACAAWTCALAAALVELAAEVTLRHGTDTGRPQEIANTARALRERALELGERDVALYAAVLERRRAGESDAAELDEASEPPLAIAEISVEVAELAREAARDGAVALRGDALAAARLADAAAGAAARLVEINLAASPDDPRVARARELAP